MTNLFERIYSAASHVRPFYYYLYQLPADFLPWTLLLPVAAVVGFREVRQGGESGRAWRLLAVWVLVPLLVFSSSSGKRGLYLLPAFPALAMMLGGAIDGWLSSRNELPRWAHRGLAGLGIAGVAGALAVAWNGGIEADAYPIRTSKNGVGRAFARH